MTNPKLHPLSVLPPTTLLYQTLTQRCVTQTCRQERVSSQLWWGWGLAVPGVNQQWMALFFSVTLNGLPSIWAGGVGYEGSTAGVCMCTGWGGGAILPSRSLPSKTFQQWWDCVACVFVLSLWGGKVLLSFPSSPCLYPHATLFLHRTYHLSQDASTRRLMDRAAASLGAPLQPGWHAWTTGYEKAVDIFTGNFLFPFSLSVTIKRLFICTRPHRMSWISCEWCFCIILC